MKPSISETDLLRLADLNLVEFWCQSAKWIPYPEILHQQDAVFINSALDFPACSFAFNLSSTNEEPPEKFIGKAKSFFAGRKKAFSLLLRGHADQAIIRFCRDNKFFLVSESPGMVLDAPVIQKPAPTDAELHWVSSADSLAAFRHIITEAYQDLEFPPEVSSKYFMHPERVLEPQFILALVHLNGEPACAAMGMLSHGIGGIYWVGTLRHFRGIGLAEYCVREVGNAAFDAGAREIVLQASQFGKPVYARIGYREFTQYPWFMCSSRQKMGEN